MSAVEVTEEAVYNCTGSPLPRDIQLRVESMLNDDFATAFDGNTHHARATLVY